MQLQVPRCESLADAVVTSSGPEIWQVIDRERAGDQKRELVADVCAVEQGPPTWEGQFYGASRKEGRLQRHGVQGGYGDEALGYQ